MKSMQRLLTTESSAALLNCEWDRAIVTLHPPDAVVLYHNTQYDFTFSLPTNWQGYSVLFQIWEGHAIPEHGPMIVLRHPQWRANDLYQDIPILIFTRSQWEANRGAGFCIGTGGFEQEIGHNRNHAFAISSRFNADDGVKGWREATDAVERNITANTPPLHAQ